MSLGISRFSLIKGQNFFACGGQPVITFSTHHWFYRYPLLTHNARLISRIFLEIQTVTHNSVTPQYRTGERIAGAAGSEILGF